MSMRATSSGSLAVGNTQVTARPACVCNVTLVPAAAACTVTVYDGISSSGRVLAVVSGTANGPSIHSDINTPVEASNALFVVVAGTGATAVVQYADM